VNKLFCPEKSTANIKNFKIRESYFKNFMVKHVHAKFQLFSFNPDGLGQIFDIFLKKNSDFFRKTEISEIFKIKYASACQLAKHVHAKF
jgi:hypothetical protein